MSTASRAPVPPAPDDDALAWELAATAHPYLSRVDADRIYITLGVGEPFAAIEILITVAAQNHIPLSDELLAMVVTWLDAYVGHDAEPRLREVLNEVKTITPQEMSAASDPDGTRDWQRPRSG